MREHRPLTRSLVRLLVLALVPVIVLATPHVAEAATKVSGTKVVQFGYDNWQWGDYASCSATVFYSVADAPSVGDPLYSQSVKTTGGDCDTPPGTNLEGAKLTLTFKGIRGDGSGCSLSGSATLTSDSESFPGLATSATAVTAGSACTVSEACFALYKDSWIPGHAYVDESGCVPVDMGPPALPDGDAPPSGTCPLGKITRVELVPGGDPGAQYPMVYVNGQAVTKTDGWSIAVVYRNEAGSFDMARSYVGVGGQVMPLGDSVKHLYSIPGASGSYPDFTRGLVGIGVGNSAPLPELSTAENQARQRAQWQTDGSLGKTLPAHCMWYFGQKYWDDGAAGGPDVPSGPLGDAPADDAEPPPTNTNPTPPATDEGCAEGFSIFNPASWATAGYCEIVSGLSSLLQALGKLAAAIFGPIVDAIEGIWDFFAGTMLDLFVPSDGFMDDAGRRLKNAWGDTAPGQWLDAFDSMVPGGVSGCGGIPFEFSMGGTTYVDMPIGAACSGKTADVAALVRIAVSAAVVVGGGMACVRALGSGFGWNPNVGRGGDV